MDKAIHFQLYFDNPLLLIHIEKMLSSFAFVDGWISLIYLHCKLYLMHNIIQLLQ